MAFDGQGFKCHIKEFCLNMIGSRRAFYKGFFNKAWNQIWTYIQENQNFSPKLRKNISWSYRNHSTVYLLGTQV
jgi:hypothetical protein